MAKYSKIKSNYIKKTLHKNIDGSTSILERDWYTLGSQLRFGPGKEPIYSDSNFIFTRGNVKFHPNKTVIANDTAKYTYESVIDVPNDSNEVKIHRDSNDIRDFAYFGSCVELIRASIENIIRWFPANLTSTNTQIELPPFDGTKFLSTIDAGRGNVKLYLMNNPFKIDLLHEHIYEEEVENTLRYIFLSYQDYEVTLDGITSPIKSLSIDIRSEGKCREELEWDNVPDNYTEDKRFCAVLSITTEDRFDVELYGFQIDGEIYFFSEYTSGKLTIQPKETKIEEYFTSLDGFEKQLLNRNSSPLYSNKFLTPVEQNLQWFYIYKTYTWPSNGYCISLDDMRYVEFVNQMYELGQKMDELWTDNIYRNMTHEAIKNFDTTHEKEYFDSDAEDNIAGGLAMQKILRFIGRVFDDARIAIDGIKTANVVTYDGYNNMPDAMLSDKLELSGWDIKSTQLDGDYIGVNCDKWYETKTKDTLTPLNVDVDMMRKLLLSSKRILSTKGTIHAIDMVMGLFGFGDDDYKITEKYYTTTPKSNEDGFIEDMARLNTNKLNQQNFDDMDRFFGIPLKEIAMKKNDNGKVVFEEYVVPYYTQDKTYDGHLYFQSRGGWGKFVGDNAVETLQDKYKYSETINYLRILTDVDDLLRVNSFDCSVGDIFYVYDLSSMAKHDNSVDASKISHFFILRNDYTQSWTAWHNITIDEINNNTTIECHDGVNPIYVPVGSATKYLDSIITTAHGNNPHSGYGRYDDGNTFLEYMTRPFKYSADNYNIETNSDSNCRFNLSEWNVDSGGKIKFRNSSTQNDEIDGDYVINDKCLIIENRCGVDNNLFKKYFKDVILHYLMQIIPSTTILLLKNF